MSAGSMLTIRGHGVLNMIDSVVRFLIDSRALSKSIQRKELQRHPELNKKTAKDYYFQMLCCFVITLYF